MNNAKENTIKTYGSSSEKSSIPVSETFDKSAGFVNAIINRSITNATCIVNLSSQNLSTIIKETLALKDIKLIAQEVVKNEYCIQNSSSCYSSEIINHKFDNQNDYFSINIPELNLYNNETSVTGEDYPSPLCMLLNKIRFSGDDNLVVIADLNHITDVELTHIVEIFGKLKSGRIFLNFGTNRIENHRLSSTLINYGLSFDKLRIFLLNNQDIRLTEIRNISELENAVNFTSNSCLLIQHSDLTIRVCTFLHSASMSGAERSHIEIVDGLVRKGILVHTICPEPDNGIIKELSNVGSSVTLLPKYDWWVHNGNENFGFSNLTGIINMDVINEIESGNFDLVLTQTSVVPQAAFAAKLLNIPHIWWIREFGALDHNLLPPTSKKEFAKLIRFLSHIVLTNSVAVREYYYPNVEDQNIRVIYPCPSLNSNIPQKTKNSSLVIGIVGSLGEGKGHLEVLKALKIVREKNIQFKLHIYGEGSAEQKSNLENEIISLDLTRFVEFKGRVIERQEIYSEIDIVIISSVMEAFGRIAFEAAESNVPIIYSNSGGIKEYMINGITGLSYDTGNYQDLAEKIEILMFDNSKRDQLKISAKKELKDFVVRNKSVDKLYISIVESISDFSTSCDEKVFNRCKRDQLIKYEKDISAITIDLLNLKSTIDETILNNELIDAKNMNLLNQIEKSKTELLSLKDELRIKQNELHVIHKLLNDMSEKSIELYQFKVQYLSIINSKIWKFTSPLRKMLNFIKRQVRRV